MQARDVLIMYFFFQAEDGIRDRTVTGVQTCALPIFSRRELIRIAAASAVTLPSAGTPATTARLQAANRPRAPEFAVAEQVPEVFTSLPSGSQELRGVLADRMRINVEGRLLRIDADACLSGFVRRDGAGSFDAAWVGEHAGKFLDAACNALRYCEDDRLRHITERMA